MSKIRIVVKKEGMFAPPVVQEMEKGLENMKAIVGGWLECPHIPGLAEEGIDLWCNEEGKFNGSKPNFMLPWGDTVHGAVFFASSNDEGDTIGLSDAQVAFVKSWMGAQPQAIVLG